MLKSCFGERLRQLRTERELGQKEIGEVINVSDSTIGKYESGERTPDPDKVVTLANFFNVSTDYLLGKTDNTNLLNDDSEKDFAKHFIELRLSSGFKTVEELAKAADVWSFTIKRIESGKSKMPSPSILEKLAKPLGISPEELIEAAGYAIVEHGYVKAYDDNFKGTKFSNLTPEEQKNILDQIEFYESRRAEKSKPQ